MGEREQRSMLERPKSMLEVAPKSIFDGYQSPSALLETPRSSGAINHSFGNVSVYPPRVSEPLERSEESKSPLEWLSQSLDMGESLQQALAEREFMKSATDMAKLESLMQGKETAGQFGDVLNVYKGGKGLYDGIGSIVEHGVTKDNALDTTKGALDTTAGFAGLLGNSPLKGYAGMASGGIDLYRGLDKAISSDDLNESTAGAYQAAEGVGSMISSYGDKTGNPWLMGGGRALNAGMAGGKYLRGTADSIDINNGYYHSDAGEVQTGSAEAADWGRSVDDYFGHSTWDESKSGWAKDKFGGFAGGVTAVAGGIGNTAYSYGHRAVDGIGNLIGDIFD